ncbi:4-oxalocrotonate tautomerase family protein [Pseudarthrobacter sp. R1]|uniref:tautomerase family protein n=1 Tax=Pseudarthrobacter sp. R1 TaxID=2944934 RepID=UPI00210ECA0C|nr:tautomerase family protein [Pseudarthrobacter sp. R1]MCQ6270121.1 4-oxalocrotonate tautomerase family protein [Pseudarthrobacter sp. R1]
MPLIEVSIARGRTPEQLRALIAELHRAAETAVGAVPDNTTVIIREIEHEHWSRGNQTIAERNAASQEAAVLNEAPQNAAAEQRSH